MNPKVKDILYWREPIKSGIILFAILTCLISLSCLSFISVIAYCSLALLCCTTGWRLYHELVGAVKKNSNSGAEGDNAIATKHPFHDWLTCDVTLPRDKISERVASLSDRLSSRIDYLRRVVLVSNYMETIKFAVCAYLLTFVGEWFNLLTLVIIAVVVAFSCPKIYELYQPQFDRAYDKMKAAADRGYKKVKAKVETLPIFGKKPKSS